MKPEDQPLGYLLYRLMSALRPAVTTELQPLGLVLPEFVCLRLLAMTPGKSNADLARDARVSPQAMNNVLRGLQDRAIVARPATVSSGRALPAELTAKGRALLKRAEAAVRVADERVLANLSAAQQREIKRLLDAAAPTDSPIYKAAELPRQRALHRRNVRGQHHRGVSGGAQR